MIRFPAGSFLTSCLAQTSTLSIGITLSVLLHTVVLTVHFQYPEATRHMRDKTLDIILVNARSARKPSEAQALAQVNLDGGGDTAENRRAKTPLPPTPQQNPGDRVENKNQRKQTLEAQQQELATSAESRRRTALAQDSTPRQAESPAEHQGLDLAESARAMARLEGELNKSIEDYNKRPRKKSIGVRTEEYRFARYIEDWRAKVERIGTLNYPEAARGRLYGALVLTVILNADGEVKSVEINRSSGHAILDEAARRIVLLGSPYAAFPPEIRRDTDILEITRRWSFTQGDAIVAR